MKEINFNHKFTVRIVSDSTNDSNRTIVLKIFIDGYLPSEDDHITFNDHFIIERNILALIGPMLGKKIILATIIFREKVMVPFNGEHLVLRCEIVIEQKLQLHKVTLQYYLKDKPIFQTEEILAIEI